MQFNGFVFPHPLPSYTTSHYTNELVYITREKINRTKRIIQKTESIPAIPNCTFAYDITTTYKQIPILFLQAPTTTSKILIYFHANAEDLGLTYSMMKAVQSFLSVHIIIMEYKGYGVYKGKTSSKSILKDAEALMLYIKRKLEWDYEDVIVMGRSIGCWFALSLAAKFKNVCGVILISPFTTLRCLVEVMVGKVLSYLVKERFENIRCIRELTCPCLIISGMKDKLAPYTMAEELSKKYSQATLFLNEDMDHTQINIRKHLILPIKSFLRKHGITISG